jgi:tellurite resistance protein TerA
MTTLTPGANASIPTSTASAIVLITPIANVDLDVSAFLLKADGKVRTDDDMCFYGQPSVAGGKVTLDQVIDGKTVFKLDLAGIPNDIEKVAMAATIHENKVSFSSFADIIMEIGSVKAAIPTAGKNETALILGEFYRRNGEWSSGASAKDLSVD